MNKVTLYNYFRSSTSFRVRIALEFKKIPYTYKSVHLLNNGGEQHSPEYRKINAMGGVPTLIHELSNETVVLGQSMAILEYLDDAFPDTPHIFPQKISEKARVKQFCENINADTHAYANLRTLQYLEKNLHINEDQKTKWIHDWTLSGLKACEDFIKNHAGLSYAGPFCFGNNITAADVVLIPQLTTAERFKVPLESVPTLQKIYQHCLTLPEFKKAHPFRQPDTPEELRLD